MRFTKILFLTITIFFSCCVHAASSDDTYLPQIANNTQSSNTILNNILQRVNNLPAALTSLIAMAIAWTEADKTTTTANMQANFTMLGNNFNQGFINQVTQQGKINSTLLGSNATTTTIPYANDLVYSTMFGVPFFATDPRGKGYDSPYNYLTNVSGISIPHVMPQGSWQGGDDDKFLYQAYYNAVMGVESFNGFIMSQQYFDAQNPSANQFNSIQSALITQASDPTSWFAKVASENIGVVLRQILMYQSQSFVVLTELLKTQRQMVTAQTMTNTLLILNNHMNENYMASKAQGVQPQP